MRGHVIGTSSRSEKSNATFVPAAAGSPKDNPAIALSGDTKTVIWFS